MLLCSTGTGNEAVLNTTVEPSDNLYMTLADPEDWSTDTVSISPEMVILHHPGVELRTW